MKKITKHTRIKKKKTDHIQLISLNFSTFVNVVCSYCYKQKRNLFKNKISFQHFY